MGWRRADIGGVQSGSGWRRVDMGAVQSIPVVTGGIMTTNTGYWGALVTLLGLLFLVGPTF